MKLAIVYAMGNVQCLPRFALELVFCEIHLKNHSQTYLNNHNRRIEQPISV